MQTTIPTHKKILVLFSLFLSLVVMMFNTSELYGYISNLIGWELSVAMYFVGISFEISIFISIYCGSRPAGAWFALISWFVGMTFHNWNEPVIFFEDPISWRFWESLTFSPTKQFFASFLLQTMNSLLSWFLSELYIKMLGITDFDEQQRKLNEELTARNEELSNLDEEITNRKKAIRSLGDSERELEREVKELMESRSSIEAAVKELEQERKSIRNSINRLGSKSEV